MPVGRQFYRHRGSRGSVLRRRKPARAPYAKVLIVCEGEKTEPLYFNGLRDHYRLNSTNVEVTGECGPDPLAVFNHAKLRYQAVS